MPQRCLHQMDRSAPVERVRGVGVPEPVWTHVRGNPRPHAGLPHDPRDSRPFQRPARTRTGLRRAQFALGCKHNLSGMAVERWLNNLALASKTRSNIRSLMHSIWECALRWELIELQRNPMEIVRVKGGSKRNARPAILTVPEFGTLLGLIPEPYKTMVIIAQCLGLRASEIMGLQWDDFDFKTMSVLIERGVVHGRVVNAKTEYKLANRTTRKALRRHTFGMRE
jgi:integrase